MSGFDLPLEQWNSDVRSCSGQVNLVPEREGESVVEAQRIDLVRLDLGLSISHAQAALASATSRVPFTAEDLSVVRELSRISGVSAESLVKLPPSAQFAFTTSVTYSIAVGVKLIVVDLERTVVATIALLVVILVRFETVANDNGETF